MNRYKEEAQKRDTPICPVCGRKAKEVETRYGIRAECCGLWSWDRYPLVDAATHEARKVLAKRFNDMTGSGRINKAKLWHEVTRRARNKMSGKMSAATRAEVKTMNAETALIFVEAIDDVMIDIISNGTGKLK